LLRKLSFCRRACSDTLVIEGDTTSRELTIPDQCQALIEAILTDDYAGVKKLLNDAIDPPGEVKKPTDACLGTRHGRDKLSSPAFERERFGSSLSGTALGYPRSRRARRARVRQIPELEFLPCRSVLSVVERI